MIKLAFLIERARRWWRPSEPWPLGGPRDRAFDKAMRLGWAANGYDRDTGAAISMFCRTPGGLDRALPEGLAIALRSDPVAFLGSALHLMAAPEEGFGASALDCLVALVHASIQRMIASKPKPASWEPGQRESLHPILNPFRMDPWQEILACLLPMAQERFAVLAGMPASRIPNSHAVGRALGALIESLGGLAEFWSRALSARDGPTPKGSALLPGIKADFIMHLGLAKFPASALSPEALSALFEGADARAMERAQKHWPEGWARWEAARVSDALEPARPGLRSTSKHAKGRL